MKASLVLLLLVRLSSKSFVALLTCLLRVFLCVNIGAKNPMSDPRLFANQKIEGESSRGADYIDMKVLHVPVFLIVKQILDVYTSHRLCCIAYLKSCIRIA